MNKLGAEFNFKEKRIHIDIFWKITGMSIVIEEE